MKYFIVMINGNKREPVIDFDGSLIFFNSEELATNFMRFRPDYKGYKIISYVDNFGSAISD